MPEPLLTVKDVAAMLNCSVSTVRRLTDDGLLPLAGGNDHQPGQYRRYRRPDVLEYLATRRESRPTTHLNAAILSTWPNEPARSLQTAALAGWAAGQDFAIVAVVYTLPDALQLLWDGAIEALIVNSLRRLGAKDARSLLAALCTQTGVKLVEANIPTPAIDPAEQTLDLAADVMFDLLVIDLGPAEAHRAVEFAKAQWQRALRQQRDAAAETASPRQRQRTPTPGAKLLHPPLRGSAG